MRMRSGHFAQGAGKRWDNTSCLQKTEEAAALQSNFIR